MKKTILALAAVATMVACSKDEIVNEAPKVPIAFNNAFVENTTRAIDGTYNTDNLTSFDVFGTVTGNGSGMGTVNIFNKVPVTKNNQEWNYADQYIQYWVSNCTYSFAAVVAGDNTINLGGYNMPTSISYDVTTQTDLLYATSSKTLGVDEMVADNYKEAFTFEHLLAKVQFTFINGITTNTADDESTTDVVEGNRYSYKISNIKINNALKKGTYTFANANSWSTSNWNNDNLTSLSFGNASNANDDTVPDDAEDICSIENNIASATSHNQMLLIPATYDDVNTLNITFTADLYLNGVKIHTKNHTINAPNVTFAKGNAYNLIIEMPAPGKQIKFTVTKVNEWNTDHDNDDDYPDNTPLS